MKKDGGSITNWQLHNLTFTAEQLESVYPGENLKPQVMTGTVVDDPTGRWYPGYHMRSSLIVKVDRKKGTVETKNTKYKITGTEGADIVPDMGNDVFNLKY